MRQYIDLSSAPDGFFSWMTLFPALQGAITPVQADFAAQTWDFDTTSGRNAIHAELLRLTAANPSTTYEAEYNKLWNREVAKEQI